jgi:preprotein translocase subunit SecG
MLLYYAIATLHVIVCVILVLVVLLQSGKGADLAGAFGGGATQTAFGSRGPASFLSKMTTVAAIVFMLTCIGLAMISTKREAKSVLETTGKQSTTPVKKPTAPPSAPVATPTPEEISKRVEELQNRKQQAAPAPAPTPASPGNQGSKK